MIWLVGWHYQVRKFCGAVAIFGVDMYPCGAESCCRRWHTELLCVFMVNLTDVTSRWVAVKSRSFVVLYTEFGVNVSPYLTQYHVL